jgi:ABC-2 type transport system permease protein
MVIRTSESGSLHPLDRVRELFSYREVIANLVRRELKVKYAGSLLGALWSLFNPLVFLAVFSFVSAVLGNPIPNFPIFLLSGLLAWNFFSTSLLAGSRSVVDNANLVKKTAFPREVLPLSTVGVAVVDFVLQLGVLLVIMIASGYAFRYTLQLSFLVVFPLSVLSLIVFTMSVTLWVAAINVRYRDVQHLLNLGLVVWFWFTPIVYSAAQVQIRFESSSLAAIHPWILYLLNPMTPIILGFQRALYAAVSPGGVPVLPADTTGAMLTTLTIGLLAETALLWLSWRLFFRLAGDFAEEL